MTVTAVTGVSLWDPMNFPGIMGTASAGRRGLAVTAGTPASLRGRFRLILGTTAIRLE